MTAVRGFRVGVAFCAIVATCSVATLVKHKQSQLPTLAPAAAPTEQPAWVPRPASARAKLCMRGGRCVDISADTTQRSGR
jgi:hypothetical protein